jgi:predicted nucleic acid-binding protein
MIDRRDAHHQRTVTLVGQLVRRKARLLTTDYVVDESCTLAKARAGSAMALRLLDLIGGTAALDLEWIGSERFRRAEVRFRSQPDQSFSFTDCTSFAVMSELGISEALSTDEHFLTAGFEPLLRSAR